MATVLERTLIGNIGIESSLHRELFRALDCFLHRKLIMKSRHLASRLTRRNGQNPLPSDGCNPVLPRHESLYPYLYHVSAEFA
jgi:hypothetical protein